MRRAGFAPGLTGGAVALFALLLTGCMGQTSREPPIQVWPDMKIQPKYKSQQVSEFYSDGRADRPPVPGTVARGHLNDDDALHTGIIDNNYVGRNPMPITADLLKTGQMRFNTYCSPCHDRTGSGKGLVPQKAMWLPTNLHEDRVLKMNDGEIFNIISHGRRSMPPYRNQIAVEDRWAIVSYVRALQRTITTTADVPEDQRAQLTVPSGGQITQSPVPPGQSQANPPAPQQQQREPR